MDSILVKGGAELRGEIPIAGAKNACLTLMPATLLTEEPLTLMNAPRLSDIKTMTVLLRSLGAEIESLQVCQVNGVLPRPAVKTPGHRVKTTRANEPARDGFLLFGRGSCIRH